MKKQRFKRAEKYEGKIRKGVKCNLIRLEKYQKEISDNRKLKYTILFGAYGLAVNNKAKVELGFTPVELSSILRIVPKGVVISIDNSDEKRVKFDEITSANKILNNIDIKLVDGKNIFITDCYKGNEVVALIN